MKTTVDLITKLQPHFLSVWTFQGWNLAYNVSVEWDAPEDKYDWIKKGIQFLQDGVQKNRKSPDLIWDTAWTYYHKLGFADECDHPPPALPRRRRRGLQDLHRLPTRGSRCSSATTTSSSATAGSAAPSTWWTRASLAAPGGDRATSIFIDPSPQHKGRPGDLAFRSMPAHAQTRYAVGLEKMSILGIPATFGEVAKNEWAKALHEWVKFGSHVYMSTARSGTRTRQVEQGAGPARRRHQPRAIRQAAPTTRSTGPTAGPTR